MKITDLNPNEYDPLYGKYINQLSKNISLRESFEQGKENITAFFNSIPKDKVDYRYAQEKWSIKEVFQHLIDTERIVMHRAFRIARNDMTPLAAFDHMAYIGPSLASKKSMPQLIEEYEVTRLFSLSLLDSLSDADLCRIGVASLRPLSARACAFHTTGHEIWHQEVIIDRYL